MYVSMEKMLQKANEDNYAVMAINCFNLESSYATISAAEEKKAPIIIDLLMEHLEKHIPREYVLPSLIKMAKDANVEVAINLDHGKSPEYVKESLKEGFSSVMIDASEMNFKENVATTKEIVNLAKQYQATVEAEVGNMGAVVGDHFTNADMYTNPDDAIKFINATNVNALSISFGSTHGVMPKDFVPVFDFAIVSKIKKATGIPLVLHGGSGCGEKNIRQAVACGINKVNVGSDVMKAQADAVYISQNKNRNMEYVDLMNSTLIPAKEMVEYYINIVGSEGKSLANK
ncbi:class II fructose-bisphosphate aldolase [Pediococcus ethanolidurans]|uniref:Fructose-bisphosphate aldolase n=1 Tax=Pediococcus ethanolidurans TaxID=319653 RepID=A0A0R2K1T4_9LACO|nr:class II fructose-bisphosphate aldolase [Pediococcus ethanolidurans]KRN83585.1 fructose-bisphosphate aldolase, class II [Pediococcus ethanolidurans]GEN94060.1 fructose-bisphosphate aldolase [Pediococcus ethanolidurans]SER03605.1 fructose-bisphosphate aldolase [Pediococcus ethanolidurans]